MAKRIDESDGWEYSGCAGQSHRPLAANGFSANIARFFMIFETICKQKAADIAIVFYDI